MYDLSSILTNYPKLNGLEQQTFIISQFLRGMNLGVTLAGLESLLRCHSFEEILGRGEAEESSRCRNKMAPTLQFLGGTFCGLLVSP